MNDEIIEESYCPECDSMNPHRVEPDWHYDGCGISYHYCKICNKMNRGFSCKDSYKEEERKRKNREYSQRRRDKKLAEIIYRNKK